MQSHTSHSLWGPFNRWRNWGSERPMELTGWEKEPVCWHMSHAGCFLFCPVPSDSSVGWVSFYPTYRGGNSLREVKWLTQSYSAAQDQDWPPFFSQVLTPTVHCALRWTGGRGFHPNCRALCLGDSTHTGSSLMKEQPGLGAKAWLWGRRPACLVRALPWHHHELQAFPWTNGISTSCLWLRPVGDVG